MESELFLHMVYAAAVSAQHKKAWLFGCKMVP